MQVLPRVRESSLLLTLTHAISMWDLCFCKSKVMVPTDQLNISLICLWISRAHMTEPIKSLIVIQVLLLAQPYSMVSQFIVRTHHSAWKWILNWTDLTNKPTRRRLRLPEFYFDIVNLVDIKDQGTDALPSSRRLEPVRHRPMTKFLYHEVISSTPLKKKRWVLALCMTRT